jgi:hypothetical protein
MLKALQLTGELKSRQQSFSVYAICAHALVQLLPTGAHAQEQRRAYALQVFGRCWVA